MPLEATWMMRESKATEELDSDAKLYIVRLVA
jgi:hypothetical protein